MRPKRSDSKYWTGTRNFDHLQYESDLEDYISDLEVENEQLHKLSVMQAEGSDGVSGAAVGNSAAGQSGRVVEYCKCGKYMMTVHAPCPCERTD